MAAWLAIQWIGAIGVPIPPFYRRREIEHVINHSGSAVILCGAGLIADIEAARPGFTSSVVVVVVPAEGGDRARSDRSRWLIDDVKGRAPAPPAYPTDRDHPALITYISSADGPLRGVVHSPANILSSADTYARDVLTLTSRDTCIGTMTLAWAFGLGALLVFPLRVGAATVLIDSGSASLVPALAATRASVLFCVPTMYRMLLQHADLDAFGRSSLRCCVSAGEPLPADVAEDWRARTGLEILDGLGTTELTHIVISARPGDARPGSIGTLVAGYDARIVDERFVELPTGTPGQLAVRGPTGCRYWRDPDGQRHAVRHGWTLTGDICVRHADGSFQHVRRSDDLIVSAGYKISIREVERVLNEHPSVERAQVFSSPDPARGAVAKATVIPAAGAGIAGLAERLQEYVKGELAAFKCPREIRVLER